MTNRIVEMADEFVMKSKFVQKVSFLTIILALPRMLPVSISLSVFLICIRLWLNFSPKSKISRIYRVIMTLLCFVVVFFEYGTFLGVSAAGTLLILALSMKLNDLKKHSDLMACLLFNTYAVLVLVLEKQTIITTAAMMFNIFIITAGFIYVNQKLLPSSLSKFFPFSSSLKTLALSLPLAAVLFVLFPRISTDFWPLYSNQAGDIGFNDSIKPGQIASLTQSKKIAFKMSFEESEESDLENHRLPPIHQRYFRGAVLKHSNGIAWNKGQATSANNINFDSRESTLNQYQIVLEPRFNDWLFALDTPLLLRISGYKKQTNIVMEDGNVFRLRKPVGSRILYSGYSTPPPKASSLKNRDQYLQIPKDLSKEIMDLVKNKIVRNSSLNATEKYKKIEEYFVKNKFRYTLKPGLLSKDDALSDFVFNKKTGFCEHFAGTAATMLRIAGVPSRVVVGFLGGEENTFDGTIIVRDQDAHAWLELYDDATSQWIRRDPTEVIAPLRMEIGGQAFADSYADTLISTLNQYRFNILSRKGSLLWNARMLFEAVSNNWNLFLLDFDRDSQYSFFSKLGLEKYMKAILLIAIFISIIVTMLILKRIPSQGSNKSDRLKILFNRIRALLSACGIPTNTNEDPRLIITKVKGARSPIMSERSKTLITDFLKLYENTQYANITGDLKQSRYKDLRRMYKEILTSLSLRQRITQRIKQRIKQRLKARIT